MARYPFALPLLVPVLAGCATILAVFGPPSAIPVLVVLPLLTAGTAVAGILVALRIKNLDAILRDVAAHPGAGAPGGEPPLPGAQRVVDALAYLAREGERDGAALARLQTSIRGQTRTLREAIDAAEGAMQAWAMESADQLHAVKRVNSSWDQVNDMAERIASQAEEVERASSQASASCEDGSSATHDAVEEMDHVREAVMAIAERMRKLRRVSEQVEETARAIDQVSTQINLLALNAAIEAAGAGEYGERFGVVAVEVKQLADQTVGATRMIKDLLNSIQDEVAAGIQLTEDGALSVQKGFSRVRDLEATLLQIRNTVDQTDSSAKSILSSTKVQVFAVRNARKEVEGIESALIQETNVEQPLRLASDRLGDLADRVASFDPEA